MIIINDRTITRREGLRQYLKGKEIPRVVYYLKLMHEQMAFAGSDCVKVELTVSAGLCKRVLALPMHPYIQQEAQKWIVEAVGDFYTANSFSYGY